MRPVLFCAFILLYLFTAQAAIATEPRDSKTVKPNQHFEVYRLPVDPQQRAKALAELFNDKRAGNGAAFMFNTKFTPANPEQTSLRPGLILNYQNSPPYTVQGYCITRDNTGLRAIKGGVKTMNNQSREIETIYAGGKRVFNAIYFDPKQPPTLDTVENNYLDSDGYGMSYFLNGLNLKGAIQGARIEKLLEQTGASRIGKENIRGTRTIVYGIQPSKKDFINGYRYLKVWVRMGDSKIIRTYLDLTYGQELTEYSNQIVDVGFDDNRFLLPGETVQDMMNEYEQILGGGNDNTREPALEKSKDNK
jgi:hypothetical protein